MKNLKGIIPYLVSPVDKNGKVLTNELNHLCDDLIHDGVHGLCIFGSVGEFPYLNWDQKQKIAKTVINISNNRVPVVCGVSSYSEIEAIKQAKKYEELGADAILLVLQVYFPLTSSEIADFYIHVANAVPSLPIVIYSNPQFMHFEFSFEIFDKFVNIPNIIYFKEASGNTGKLLTLINKYENRFILFSASAHIPMFVSMLGGVGWMAGPACLIPKQSVKLFNYLEENNYKKAIELQKKIWIINTYFQKYKLVPCIKSGLQFLGYEVGDPILPLKPLSKEDQEKLGKALLEIRKL